MATRTAASTHSAATHATDRAGGTRRQKIHATSTELTTTVACAIAARAYSIDTCSASTRGSVGRASAERPCLLDVSAQVRWATHDSISSVEPIGQHR